jgi:hypothetical protein
VTALGFGSALGAGAAVVNNVPIFLGEVGEARADRSGWSQAAEFASLVLDSGWAWAAMAVAVGWLVSKGLRPMAGVLLGALVGCVALLAATVAYDSLEALFQGGTGGGWRLRYWLVLGLVRGSPLGAVGATLRRPGLMGVLAALVVPVGAALNMVVVPPPNESLMAVPVTLTVWGAAAAATVVVVTHAVRSRRDSTRRSGAGPDDGIDRAVSAS